MSNDQTPQHLRPKHADTDLALRASRSLAPGTTLTTACPSTAACEVVSLPLDIDLFVGRNAYVMFDHIE